jgi:hypothetical protein
MEQRRPRAMLVMTREWIQYWWPVDLEAVMNLRAAENFRYLGIGLRYRD